MCRSVGRIVALWRDANFLSVDDKTQTIEIDTSDFVEVKYPGPKVRPVPTFSIDIPPHWVISEYPGSLFAMGTPATSRDPWSNVIVQHDRVLPNTALEQVAILSWQDLKAESPDAVVKDEQMLLFELYHYVREVELSVQGVTEKVTRFDSFVFGPDVDHVTVDLFHFTWTHPVAAGDERTALYLHILSTLHFQ